MLCKPLILLLLVAIAVAAAAKLMTEADFKKMKIKELKAFLEERGITCKECQEKSEFVSMAVANAGKPTIASVPSKKEVPKGALWEVWGGIASEKCAEAATKSSIGDASKDICSAVATATESVFMQYGKRTASKLKKDPSALLKTSFAEPYHGAGRRLLGRVITHCFKPANRKACSSASRVQPLMENAKIEADFVSYLTNVGIENTNPMYEALKGKHDEL